MENLRKAAERVLDWKNRPRECVRYGVTLATMVLRDIPAEKPVPEPEKPKKTSKKAIFRRKTG